MPIIYAIYASPCHLPYYGSTNRTLARRKKDHKYSYKRFKAGKAKNCSAYKLFDDVGFENCIFEIVECLPDDFTKKQILECEKFWIQNNVCINMDIPIRTEEEIKKQACEWRKANRDKIKEYNSNYRKANRDKIKEYKIVNRAKINERQNKRRAEKKLEVTL